MSDKLITLNQSLQQEAKWMLTRGVLLDESKAVEKVDSDSALDVSGSIQTRIQKHIKSLGKHRLELTRPIDALKKDIMAQEKKLKTDLDAELARLKSMNDAYATAVYEKQEADRLKAEEKAAAEIEDQQQTAEDVFGAGVEFDDNFTPPVVIPEVVKPTASNNRTVIRWNFQVVDPAQVPREFLSVDEKKIRSHVTYKTKMNETPTIPGVNFQKHVSVESR